MTDTIADLLTRIRNAQAAQKADLTIPYSRIKKEICEILKQHNFITGYEVQKGESFDNLLITLDQERTHQITLTRISKPGQRIYKKAKELKVVKSGLGIAIISTPQGLLTNYQAKKANIGGEILCTIY